MARPNFDTLQVFFAGHPNLPAGVKIAPGSVVADPQKFVATHLAALANPAAAFKVKSLFYLRLESFYYAVCNSPTPN